MSSRRDFFKRLSGDIVTKTKEEGRPLFLRPPYNRDRELFDKECIECEGKECIKACDENIILIEANKTPILNFSKSGCTFCQDCADACSRGVLVIDETTKKIDATFLIKKESCMAHNGSICFSCKEPCLEDAILFKGMFEPIIDMELCTSCGFCISRCPTNAIEFIIRR